MRTAAAALALSVAAATPVAASPSPHAVIRVGCRQGECGWLRIGEVRTASDLSTGRLLRVTARRGISVHLDGSIPARPDDANIEWDASESVEFAFCSRQRPAYAFPDGQGRLIVHFLDLFNLGGYQQGSALLYLRFCHDRTRLPRPSGLRALGYRAGTRSEQVEAENAEVMTDFTR